MEYERASIIAPYIEGLLSEKRANGYKYDTEEGILNRFDLYCLNKGLDTINISKDFLEDWMVQSLSEGAFNQGKRISTVRQVLKYMASMGIPVYLPENFCHFTRALPHIFSSKEIASFFKALDSNCPPSFKTLHVRLHQEYRLIFRLYCCCGFRNSEVLNLAVDDVDLKRGVITIFDSKFSTDRLVYLPEKLKQSCIDYKNWMNRNYQYSSKWFFPASDPSQPFNPSSMDNVFDRFWYMTPYAANCNNKPTIHDFRFTFVVLRTNSWADQGIALDVMLPYLSRYLGHASVKETLYYYYMVQEAYSAIQKNDTVADSVIPEANEDEYQFCLF